MENEARLYALQRLCKEGQPLEEELEKATTVAIRQVEDDEELQAHATRQVIPQPEWERDHIETEDVIFERRRYSRRITRSGRVR